MLKFADGMKLINRFVFDHGSIYQQQRMRKLKENSQLQQVLEQSYTLNNKQVPQSRIAMGADRKQLLGQELFKLDGHKVGTPEGQAEKSSKFNRQMTTFKKQKTVIKSATGSHVSPDLIKGKYFNGHLEDSLQEGSEHPGPLHQEHPTFKNLPLIMKMSQTSSYFKSKYNSS